MSRFSDQIARGLARIRATAGEAVTYNDGTADVSIELAVPRRIKPKDDQQYDQHILTNGKIWDIDVAQLVVGDNRIIPAEGHVLTQTKFGSQVAWEVLPNPITNRCWEYLDEGESTISVFTLLKGM